MDSKKVPTGVDAPARVDFQAPLQPSTTSAMAYFFSPSSVALIGATDRKGSVGRTVAANLLSGAYKGEVFLINSRRQELLGRPCYSSIAELPHSVDLAVVMTPAATVPEVVAECVQARSNSIVVISAGFKERGPEGLVLEQQVRSELRAGAARLIGPNCLGIMNPWHGLNATFAQDAVRPGNVAFLSQSGALLTAILDWSLAEQVGFSGIVSTGSMLDVGWSDLISYFGDDPKTESILIYMESIGDARSFLSAAREVSFSKPIIVIKAGRTEAASKAAASHTGALTGSDLVYDAAFARCGVLRVSTIADLFHMAKVLAKQPRPRGPRLMILTNAGGPGVLATDTLISSGGELAPLSPNSVQSLNSFLPEHWSHGNPIDILGDADADRYARALQIAIEDSDSDGLLAILAPQGMTDPVRVASRLGEHAHAHNKPVLASWMGGKGVSDGVDVLNAAGIPTFAYPDTAARVFQSMWQHSYNMRALYETPFAADDPTALSARREAGAALLQRAFARNRTLLTEAESKELLSLYQIPIVRTKIAPSEDAAVQIANEMHYPVVLKLHSETITHKTEVDGVKLNLSNDESVRSAFRSISSSVTAKAGASAFLGVTVQPMVSQQGYELILGSSVDVQFGPVLLFGSGGQLVEVYRDRALALPPLTTTLAHRFMEQTRIYKALRGIRGRQCVDLAALESLLVRFSQLVVEQPRIREIDINPLLASPEAILALDARVVLIGSDVSEENLPRPSVRPYPAQYVARVTLKTGNDVTIRPIRPEDEPLMTAFHRALSETSVRYRFFRADKLENRVSHERLLRKCFIDYDREMALVAEFTNAQSGTREILAVGRLTRLLTPSDAELGLIVADRWQGRGLGAELVQQLIRFARAEKIHRIVAHILTENQAMLRLAQRFHFSLTRDEDPAAELAVLELKNDAA
jgi:acetyltransferase